MKILRKKENGITLIVLVITIIILLILVGVTITQLTGSGLFEKAKLAKQKSEDAHEQENTMLKEYENTINGYLLGNNSLDKKEKILNYAETAKPENSTITEKDASKGIVMVDSSNNEWVWVEVPETVFKIAKSNKEYDNIKTDLINYAKDYRKGSATQTCEWIDEWYDGCGVKDKEKYIEMYNKMLSSVYTNKGFWISRYEIGDATSTNNYAVRTKDSGTSGTAVSRADQIPYNYVTCSQAQGLASGMSTDTNKISSLLFGIQWDLTCKFIEENTDLELADINSDSTDWGNYKNNSLTLNRGKYNILPSSSTSVWKEYTTETENYVNNKQTSNNTDYYQLLTTGTSEQTNKMNIYDFAGNEFEWILEHATYDTKYPCTNRGGGYSNYGSKFQVSARNDDGISDKYVSLCFRVTLY